MVCIHTDKPALAHANAPQTEACTSCRDVEQYVLADDVSPRGRTDTAERCCRYYRYTIYSREYVAPSDLFASLIGFSGMRWTANLHPSVRRPQYGQRRLDYDGGCGKLEHIGACIETDGYSYSL